MRIDPLLRISRNRIFGSLVGPLARPLVERRAASVAAAIGGRIVIDGYDIRVIAPLDKELAAIVSDYDLRAMTPRDMAEFAYELYKADFLTKEEYADLSFQPELMHNFDRTVGALTGEKAAPDRPRDYLTIWRERLAFEESHLSDDYFAIDRTRRIVRLLEDIGVFQRDGTDPTAAPVRKTPSSLPSSLLRLGS